MLSRLYIRNYALISELDIEFPPGLSIITGETGAGKSIMLGALSLLTGARAENGKKRRPGEKTVIEAEFQLASASPALRELLAADSDAEAGQETDGPLTVILRRELGAGGRTRAFINDSPATLTRLAEVASHLVDIHSQHNNSLLSDEAFQLRLIDAVAADGELLADYRSLFSRYVALRNELRRRRETLARNREQEEFIRFRLENLRKLKPRAGEQAELERRRDLLAGSEELRSSIGEACALLDQGDASVAQSLHRARTALSCVDLALLQTDGEEDADLLRRLESAEIELRDISYTLQDYYQRVDADPVLLARTEARLEAIYEAERRFKVADDTALVALQRELEASLRQIEGGGDGSIEDLEKELRALAAGLKEAAARLSAARTAAARRFSEELLEMARPLGLANLKFAAVLEPGKLSADGADRPQFLCAFNKNQELMPVDKVASGGEISRLMLCVKALVAGKIQLPTIIFDEVDTGVSGDIASRMGRLMRLMSDSLQVIVITHLPQVAAAGQAHYRVYKEDTGDATLTHIARLTPQEREREIARMLSGAVIDEAALLNARSLLASAAL